MNVANPDAIEARISLEKKPIIQSTDVADLKQGINTSWGKGSFGRM